MILGVTHTEDGRAVQSLAITTKVAIGLGPDDRVGRKAPKKLDHFIFLKKVQEGTAISWEEDSELTKHYKTNPRELEIILIDDDLENCFPTEYAWWVAGGKVCWGDGAYAIRRLRDKPDPVIWAGEGADPPHPCGQACPDLKEGRCKPSADLYFILADFPALGRVCRIHTSSYRSIRQIHSALEQIRTITGGRLAGIKVWLHVRPEKTSYADKKDKGKRKSTTVWSLSLEMPAQDFKTLLAKMTETARMYESTRKLLGGRTIEYRVVEDEDERAPEIQAEFAPDNGDTPKKGGTAKEDKHHGEQVDPLSSSGGVESQAARGSSPKDPTRPAANLTSSSRPPQPPKKEPKQVDLRW